MTNANNSQLSLQRSLPLGFYTYITGKLAAWWGDVWGDSIKSGFKITKKPKYTTRLQKLEKNSI